MEYRHIFSSVLAALCFSIPVGARAATWHVHLGGSGDFTTIQAALSSPLVTTGDVVIVAKGVYPENINLMGKAVTLQSSDPNDIDTVESTVIYGSLSGTCVTFDHGEGADTVVKGFRISHGMAQLGGGILCSGSSPTISNCIIHDNWAGSDGGGISNWYGSSPTVTGCAFINNVGEDHGGGIYNDPSCDPVITNCLFLGNNRGIDNGQGPYSGSPVITNCTFVQNTVCGIRNYASSMVVTNCIMWDTTPILSPGTLPLVTYSNVRGGWPPPDRTNMNADPCFIDAGSGNFGLLPGSPCIDAGSNYAVPSGISRDLVRAKRFYDDPNTIDTGAGSPPVVDMGAYEYQLSYAICGDGEHPILPGDYNRDCIVDFTDFAYIATNWLVCTKPECD